uniref:Uncharacterized protein n=1 Tax=Parastrongyloides trichosuri TaxID=131310 RepID=A0A0N4ZBQ5_PARTI
MANNTTYNEEESFINNTDNSSKMHQEGCINDKQRYYESNIEKICINTIDSSKSSKLIKSMFDEYHPVTFFPQFYGKFSNKGFVNGVSKHRIEFPPSLKTIDEEEILNNSSPK